MSDIYELEIAAEQLRSEGKYAEAAETLQQLIAQDENFARAHLALAVTYHHLADYEKAVHHGERACQIEPDDPFNFTALSVTYRRAFAGTNDPRFIQMAEDAMAKANMMMHG